MALLFSKHTRGVERNPAPQNAGDVVCKRFTYDITAALSVSGNIVDLGVLPAHARVVDAILDATDLDTNATPTISVDVGIMSGSVGEALDSAGAARTSGAELFSGSTLARAGGIERLTLRTGLVIEPVVFDRSIGVKLTAAPATATAGTIGLTVLMASK